MTYPQATSPADRSPPPKPSPIKGEGLASADWRNRKPPKRKRGPALLPGPVSPDFCRRPGRILGMVSAAPQSAPARACEPWVGRRGWPLSAHPEGELRLPASAARFVLPAGGRNSEALLDTICSVRSLPNRPLRLRFASGHPVSAAGRSFVPGPERLRAVSANQGIVPFPSLPSASNRACAPFSAWAPDSACAPPSASASGFAFAPPSASSFARRLRAALHSRSAPQLPAVPRFRSSRALASLETSAARGRRFRFATFRGFASPNRSRMRFPEGTCTVSGPCKPLILLWFPAAGPFRLQL